MKKSSSRVLILFSDGGSRGNPGPAAIGAVIRSDNGKCLSRISKTIGVTTNNVAEYLAAVYALQEAFLLGAESVILNLDSQLVARQLRGEYKVKDPNMRIFRDIALNLFRGFDKVEVRDIPRKDNKEADRLVNDALDRRTLI